jgi:hypothetical protein
MVNASYELNWKIFLKCKECWEFKELNFENWYKHNQWYLWVLWRCKNCILAWRKTEHELSMSRKRDMDRYYNNSKRRDYIFKSWAERRRKKWYSKIHAKTERAIKKLGIRPSKCQLCWYKWRIIAHHPDYNKWNEIVFCCQICHDKIHHNKITDYKIINLLD